MWRGYLYISPLEVNSIEFNSSLKLWDRYISWSSKGYIAWRCSDEWILCWHLGLSLEFTRQCIVHRVGLTCDCISLVAAISLSVVIHVFLLIFLLIYSHFVFYIICTRCFSLLCAQSLKAIACHNLWPTLSWAEWQSGGGQRAWQQSFCHSNKSVLQKYISWFPVGDEVEDLLNVWLLLLLCWWGATGGDVLVPVLFPLATLGQQPYSSSTDQTTPNSTFLSRKLLSTTTFVRREFTRNRARLVGSKTSWHTEHRRETTGMMKRFNETVMKTAMKTARETMPWGAMKNYKTLLDRGLTVRRTEHYNKNKSWEHSRATKNFKKRPTHTNTNKQLEKKTEQLNLEMAEN